MKRITGRFFVLSLLITLTFFAFIGCGKSDGDNARSSDIVSDDDPVVSTVVSDTGKDEIDRTNSNGAQIILKESSYLLFLNGGESSVRPEFTLYEDAKPSIDGKVSFSVEDDSVAQIENGILSAKKVGSTRLVLRYKNATNYAVVSVTDGISQNMVNSFDERYVNLYGRTYLDNGKLCLDNPGSAVEVAQKGGLLSARIEVDNTVYVWVETDGIKTERVKLTPDKTDYTLVTGLSGEYHVLRIINSSEASFGQIRICALYSDTFFAPPEKPDFLVEYIGDSITAGYGSLGTKGDVRTVDNSDACSTYAYLSARELGVDYSTIAVSGIAVTKRVWDSKAKNMEEVYPCYSAINETPYEFSRPADVVVINLGTNDNSYLGWYPDYKYKFPEDYLRFLKYVRSKNPNAFIICLYGFASKGKDISDGISAAVKAMNNASDNKIVYLENTFRLDGSGVNGHPPVNAQIEWGKILADYIGKLINLK